MKNGDKVRLKADALQLHSRSVPAYAGYTQTTLDWRASLSPIQDDRTIGTVAMTFTGSQPAFNVEFNGRQYHVPGFMLEEVTVNG